MVTQNRGRSPLLCRCLCILVSHKPIPTSSPAAPDKRCEQCSCIKMWQAGLLPYPQCLLACPCRGAGTSTPRAAWQSHKRVLLGIMRPSNNPALDLRRPDDISQLKISTIHFSQQILGIFHRINSLLLIPSFYCKISESSSLPPTPTDLEMRTEHCSK